MNDLGEKTFAYAAKATYSFISFQSQFGLKSKLEINPANSHVENSSFLTEKGLPYLEFSVMVLLFCVKPYQAFRRNLVHIKLVFQTKMSKLLKIIKIVYINQLRTFGSLFRTNKIGKYIHSS